MSSKRKTYSAELKAKVALEALRGELTTNQIATRYEVHPSQVTQWKKQALEHLKDSFSSRRAKAQKQDEALQDELYGQIGRLKVELDWLKKNLDCSVDQKRQMIVPGHAHLSIERQCELVGLSRSSNYYVAKGENSYNLELMRLIDEQYTRRPFFGIRRMTDHLRRQGHEVNHKRVQRLMRLMGLEAIYPKPKMSQAHLEHRTYPYLLRGLVIDRPDQVWCSDVTYIRLVEGFLYLVAIMDWYNRFVLAWRLSNTLDAGFCVEALEEALSQGRPEIFNTDQGVQFTSTGFTSVLEEAQVQISMDGRGRCFDNIMVERLWRSVKRDEPRYEEVYLKDYQQVGDARRGLGDYFPFYNRERGHQSLDYRTPYEVYHGLAWGAGDGTADDLNTLTLTGSTLP